MLTMYYTVTVKTFAVIVNRVLHGIVALTKTSAVTENHAEGVWFFALRA
jgi:hypothetical protein